MMRSTVAMMLLAGLGSGCMTANPTNPAKTAGNKFNQAQSARKTVPGLVGPRGEPVAVRQNGVANMPYGQARVNGMTGDILQAKATTVSDSGVVPTGFMAHGGPAPGCTNCGPSGMGGFAGPTGPIAPPVPMMGPPGAVAAVGALPNGQGPIQLGNARTSVFFAEPAGMRVSWLTGGFGEHVIEMPGRYNFLQGGIYRFKLSNIPSLPNKELYPTVEVMPATHKTATFLAHSSVPVTFTEEDLEQIVSGNFLVKVIYLPDYGFQDIAALAGPNEIVSTRLEPGVDPIVEAQKRGSILLIVRVGNIDLQAPNTPAMDAPNANAGGPFGPGVIMGGPGGSGPIPGIPIEAGPINGGPIGGGMIGGGSGPIPGIPIVPGPVNGTPNQLIPNGSPIPGLPVEPPISKIPDVRTLPKVLPPATTPSTTTPAPVKTPGPVGMMLPPSVPATKVSNAK